MRRRRRRGGLRHERSRALRHHFRARRRRRRRDRRVRDRRRDVASRPCGCYVTRTAGSQPFFASRLLTDRDGAAAWHRRRRRSPAEIDDHARQPTSPRPPSPARPSTCARADNAADAPARSSGDTDDAAGRAGKTRRPDGGRAAPPGQRSTAPRLVGRRRRIAGIAEVASWPVNDGGGAVSRGARTTLARRVDRSAPACERRRTTATERGAAAALGLDGRRRACVGGGERRRLTAAARAAYLIESHGGAAAWRKTICTMGGLAVLEQPLPRLRRRARQGSAIVGPTPPATYGVSARSSATPRCSARLACFARGASGPELAIRSGLDHVRQIAELGAVGATPTRGNLTCDWPRRRRRDRLRDERRRGEPADKTFDRANGAAHRSDARLKARECRRPGPERRLRRRH